MKRPLLTCLMMLSAWVWTCEAQSSGLPNNKAKKTFKQMYSHSSEVDWRNDEDGGIVASFDMEDGSKEAYFDTKGNWLRTITYIIDKDLPKGVIRYVNEHYEEATIYDTRKYQDPDTPLEYKVILTIEDWESDEEEAPEEEDEEVVVSDGFSDWVTFLVLTFSESGKFLSVKQYNEN